MADTFLIILPKSYVEHFDTWLDDCPQGYFRHFEPERTQILMDIASSLDHAYIELNDQEIELKLYRNTALILHDWYIHTSFQEITDTTVRSFLSALLVDPSKIDFSSPSLIAAKRIITQDMPDDWRTSW